MINLIDKSKCCGCFGCEQICPKTAIIMQKDNEGFWYPHIDAQKCINCGLCDNMCPVLNPAEVSAKTEIYAAYCKNFEDRIKSSSGGIFSVIAEKVISQNGVAFGAGFDKLFELKHMPVDDVQGLDALRGSKYVQSNMSGVYTSVLKFLQSGKMVLFSGTPCQVSGLKKFLGKDYKNLITIDLVCHGVPSPAVWQKYITELGAGSELVAFNQRCKEDGISKSYLSFEFENGKTIKQGYTESLFMRGFSQNLYLRNSCYDCNFKGIERCSDITIGDFWGIEKFHPEFSDDYGISLVMIHSDRGEQFFKDISAELNILQSNSQEAVAENPCVVKSVEPNKNREEFFNNFKKESVIALTKKFTQNTSTNMKFWRIYDSFVHPLWKLKNKITGLIKR